MKVQTVSRTGTGSTDAVVINTNISPVNIGFAVIVTGTVNYSVQFTYDDDRQPGFHHLVRRRDHHQQDWQ